MERELTEPVSLCLGDGTTLNPDAVGWSRHLLHTANLGTRDGRNKRWDFWAVLAGDLVVSTVYFDVDYLGLADVWWVDMGTGKTGGGMAAALGGEGFDLPELAGSAPLVAKHPGFEIEITDDPVGTRILANWSDSTGADGRLDVMIATPEGHETLNVVIPWSDSLYNFTSKHQARPAVGEMSVGDSTWTIGGPGGDAWGVLDVGRGRWPSEIVWNWGGGAGRSGDHVVGVQIGAKWTEGTGYTENAVVLDGRLTKLSDELEWSYDWDEPMELWRVNDPGGHLTMELAPRYDKYTNVPGDVQSTEVHQVFGTWSGHLVTDDGVRVDFSDVQGFAEEARQRW